MTVVDRIIQAASAYPDRPAIVTTDGDVTLYRDIASVIGGQAQWVASTTGFTGPPKKVLIDDATMAARIARFTAPGRQGLVGISSLFTLMPPISAVGIALRLYALSVGATYYIQGKQALDGPALLAFCAQQNVDAFTYAPYFSQISLTGKGQSFRFKKVFLVGKPISQWTRRRIQDSLGPVFLNYGTTEAGPAIAETTLDATDADVAVVGAPHPDLNIGIDPDGQVKISGPGVVSGYVDDPVATAKQFRNGWFYPGDIGRMQGGVLAIDGRL
jgi:acyl-CoA synthetase (AMP-forming)/AMP-acid ligase II